jgi:hypothetical protein
MSMIMPLLTFCQRVTKSHKFWEKVKVLLRRVNPSVQAGFFFRRLQSSDYYKMEVARAFETSSYLACE